MGFDKTEFERWIKQAEYYDEDTAKEAVRST
jgi:hypothetical protein